MDIDWTKFHKLTKKFDPLGHYAVNGAWKSSTKLVNQLGKATGWDWLENQSGKDQGDIDRWLENTGAGVGAVFGAMYGAGALGGSGGGAAGAGAGGGATNAALAESAVGTSGYGASSAGAGGMGGGGGFDMSQFQQMQMPGGQQQQPVQSGPDPLQQQLEQRRQNEELARLIMERKPYYG